ncbi:MAG: GyrI-like domain-containing protein [Bellilinea sp.]
MEKIDTKQAFKYLYLPTAKSVVKVVVPPMNFLMADGAGDPNISPDYQVVVEALFSTAYAIKFMVKKGPAALDYGVMPLEGLWWADDMIAFSVAAKSDWKWTMMIMQPDPVTREMVDAALETGKKKELAAISRLRFETFDEGLCAQTLHVGPFSAEGPTVARVHDFIDAHGRRRGKHHEIYLSDIRKADPAKWKTVIRQPMEEI